MKCKARRYSDEMICHHCSLRWDVSDMDPPHCEREDHEPVPKPIQNAVFAELRNKLKSEENENHQ